jgi:hypothetical protein
LEKKSNSIRFRLTPELENAIKQGAADRNMTISQYCRLCLMAHHNLDGSDDLPTITKMSADIKLLFEFVNYHHPILKRYKEDVIPAFQKIFNNHQTRLKTLEQTIQDLGDRLTTIQRTLDNQHKD